MFNREEKDISVATSTLIKIVLVGLILWFAWAIRDILVLVLIAVTLASGLEPLVDALHRWRIPRSISVLAVYIFALGVVALIGYVAAPAIIDQFGQLRDSHLLQNQFQSKVASSGFLHNFNMTDIIARNVKTLSDQFTNVSGDFFKTTLGVFGSFVEVIAVMVISFYLLAERNGMKHFVYTIVPKEKQPEVLHVINKIQKKVGLWLIGQIMVSLSIFAITWVMLTLLGVHYALTLALLAGLFELIPYLGPIISAIPAIFFAFLQAPTLALFVLIAYVLLSKFEGYVLVPKIMQRTVGVSPLVILIGILVGFKLDGFLGVLLAVPVIAMINVVIEEWDVLKGTRKVESIR